MSETFLEGESCERCGGPISNRPHTKTIFIEESFDYLHQTVWICYSCGKEHTLQSEPYHTV